MARYMNLQIERFISRDLYDGNVFEPKTLEICLLIVHWRNYMLLLLCNHSREKHISRMIKQLCRVMDSQLRTLQSQIVWQN